MEPTPTTPWAPSAPVSGPAPVAGPSRADTSPAFAEVIFAGYVAAQAFVGRSPLRLHLGCGSVHLDGWVNIDIEGSPDLRLDLRYGLPFPDGSVDLIHSEHVFEHFSLPIGQLLMAEAYRALRPGGVMRIAMPDLAAVVRRFGSPEWRDQDWIQDPAYDVIDTPAAYINLLFHGWGHEYLYDEPELFLRLAQAGFTAIRRLGWGESEHEPLRSLETRSETELIVEAMR